VAPAFGDLIVEGAVDALEPALYRWPRRLMRDDVETVGQDRVGR
jgi:hypothetical protein